MAIGFRGVAFPWFLLFAVSLVAAEPPPVRVARTDDVVEVDNGLVKARFTVDAYGVKQEYLAARGAEWVLLAEGFRPRNTATPKVEVFADFEGATYGDWQVVGEAFGAGPSPGATAPEQLLHGLHGKRLANSYAKSDAPVGKIISPEFTIERPYIGFLIGGGRHPGATCINLIVDGKTVATETGRNSDTMSRAEWCVVDSIGKKARIEIVDDASGGWGHVEIDRIEFADRPRGSAAPLYDTSIDPAHRFLASEALRSVGRVEENADSARVVLQGTIGETAIEQTIELRRGQQFVHIEVNAALAGNPPKLEYLLSPFVVAIDGAPDVTHAPAFKPAADSVIGDRVFFAPVVSVQKGGDYAALVPDLDIINRHVVYAKGARQHPDSNSFPVPVDPQKIIMPTALDLELSSLVARPVLSYGMMDYIVHQHVWFQHPNVPGAMVRELSAANVRIGMDLLLSTGVPECRGYQMAARHLWRRYGSECFHRPRPQVMPSAEYAKTCYPANFDYQGYDVVSSSAIRHRNLPDKPQMNVWQQWEVDGRPVGGLRLHAPQWYQFIANLGWWNNVCDATGLYYWGRELNDPDLTDKARRMVNLALSAPQNRGLFPGVYNIGEKRWIGSFWNPPAQGYDPAATNAYWDWKNGAYQTAAASVTAGYLMQYRRTCEDDPRILAFVRAYGDFLVANVQADGCVPAWFSADLKPLPSLSWNADGGAHVWVLSELYSATDEPKYLDAARKIARFMTGQVMPHQRWVDFEALYSCARKPETFFDVRTGQGPCNIMSISWALQGFLSLYEATHESQYLDGAEAVADFASLFQAVWAPNYITTAYPFGGLSSQLGDAEWLDQRAHRFADPLVRIGLLTGRTDLVQRGIAAARSSLTLASLPEQRANGVHNYPHFPPGLGPENIDHEGFPQMPLSSGPSWSTVGGLAGTAHVLGRLGGLYVDFTNDVGVGVDGVDLIGYRLDGNIVRLQVKNQLAALPSPYAAKFTVELRVEGLPDPDAQYRLVVNSNSPVTVTRKELASYSLQVPSP